MPFTSIFPSVQVCCGDEAKRFAAVFGFNFVRDEVRSSFCCEGIYRGNGNEVSTADLNDRATEKAAYLGDGREFVVEFDRCLVLVGEGNMRDLSL